MLLRSRARLIHRMLRFHAVQSTTNQDKRAASSDVLDNHTGDCASTTFSLPGVSTSVDGIEVSKTSSVLLENRNRDCASPTFDLPGVSTVTSGIERSKKTSSTSREDEEGKIEEYRLYRAVNQIEGVIHRVLADRRTRSSENRKRDCTSPTLKLRGSAPLPRSKKTSFKRTVIALPSSSSSSSSSSPKAEVEISSDAELYDTSSGSEYRDTSFDDSGEESMSNRVVTLLKGKSDLEELTLVECKAYLRKHGLRLSGTKAESILRIKEHWRLKGRMGEELYPISSFSIDCTGDACKGDVVLFTQNIYKSFNTVTRIRNFLGKRIVAGRIVNDSYGAAKQQETFTVEVLWSKGRKKLRPLFPLLVKGRNLYRMRTYRQPWVNEDERLEVLAEKHQRGAAARSIVERRRENATGVLQPHNRTGTAAPHSAGAANQPLPFADLKRNLLMLKTSLNPPSTLPHNRTVTAALCSADAANRPLPLSDFKKGLLKLKTYLNPPSTLPHNRTATAAPCSTDAANQPLPVADWKRSLLKLKSSLNPPSTHPHNRTGTVAPRSAEAADQPLPFTDLKRSLLKLKTSLNPPSTLPQNLTSTAAPRSADAANQLLPFADLKRSLLMLQPSLNPPSTLPHNRTGTAAPCSAVAAKQPSPFADLERSLLMLETSLNPPAK